MDFFKNIQLSLQATGPAAVLCVWMICFTVLALYGKGSSAFLAIGTMAAFGGLLVVSLGSKVR